MTANPPLRVCIVGAGSLGCLFATRLSYAGALVTLVQRGPQSGEGVVRDKVTIRLDHPAKQEKKEAVVTLAEGLDSLNRGGLEDNDPFDLVMVNVKHHDTKGVANGLFRALERNVLQPKSAIVSMQNGIGNTDILKSVLGGKVSPGSILPGLTYTGASLTEPLVSRCNGNGATIIQAPRSDISVSFESQHVSDILHRFQICYNAGTQDEAGFASVVDDIMPLMWTKLLVNAVLNPIVALANQTNSYILDPWVLPMVQASCDEFEQLAVKEDVELQLNGHSPVDFVLSVGKASNTNVCSTVADLRQGRQTELEAINGFVSRRAAAHGLKVPVLDSLYRLVSTLDHN